MNKDNKQLKRELALLKMMSADRLVVIEKVTNRILSIFCNYELICELYCYSSLAHHDGSNLVQYHVSQHQAL